MYDSTSRAIAIVGVGAVLPDALDAQTFWQNILNKRYSITDVPNGRWDPALYYDADPKQPDATYSKIGGWVQDFEFDWRRFRMPPKVAGSMDEGQQWALSIAADALDDYGYPDRALNTERTAVILGTAMGGERVFETHTRVIFPEFANALKTVKEFAGLQGKVQKQIVDRWREVFTRDKPPITEDTMPGELPNIISGRVANILDLQGPNFITDAACASSFAAINSAFEMLAQHQIDAAIAGGVDRNMGVSTFVKFCRIGALSATGSRPFADGADGFVMGEGAAVFLLKRLEDAERAGDKIYAVIRGVGGSSDGRGKGITAPNPDGQKLSIERAWQNAGLDPATATMVEAHGTSTRVGDVVEFETLASIFGGAPSGSIALGSVKSNIGHLKAGAGAAGLLKAAMALHHKTLPPTLSGERPNPNIDFEHSPFYLNTEVQDWQANGTPRRCGVSAYGFGGTNFHVVLEEYVPGMLKPGSRQVTTPVEVQPGDGANQSQAPVPKPLRGILALGANSQRDLKDQLDQVTQRAETGWMPTRQLPSPSVIESAERLLVDFGDHDELVDRLHRAQKAMGFDTPQAWSALAAQGVYRGSGTANGKIAFIFPGQGSQYLNMGRDLVDVSPIVAETFREADEIMTPILGRPLTDFIFVDEITPEAEIQLLQTEITQPAVLTMDVALYRLLQSYGFDPDMVMGHSLGEYAALIVSGVMPFADALEAAAARGSEMSAIEVDDNGLMAAVLAPLDVVKQVLADASGYVVPANINSYAQSVIGGASDAVRSAVNRFEELGHQALTLPVSHAFHTRIVEPASTPLRKVLDRLNINVPRIPLAANVTGEFYPETVDEIKDMLELQIASPVQWVKSIETLYESGVRTFVEVGPKRALRSFVENVLSDQDDVVALITSHPKTGEVPTFNQALCGLFAAGHGLAQLNANEAASQETIMAQSERPPLSIDQSPQLAAEISQLVQQSVEQALSRSTGLRPQGPQVYDRHQPPTGSIIISGTGLGLPGAEKALMDPDNAMNILRGTQYIDLIPERFRKKMLQKVVTRLVKGEDGSGRFEPITDPNEVIKLAGRMGKFDLSEEYGVPDKLIEALDITTQMAVAAGLDALREAGIPLVQQFRETTTGKMIPVGWMLPEALRDETGVIFASAFAGGDRLADEFTRYYEHQNRLTQLDMLEDIRRTIHDPATQRELDRRITSLKMEIEQDGYEFDRRFLFRVLVMGHSQFAQYIGARGPNTAVNAACASTTQAVGMAEDWIRNGRCRRVIVVAADNVTSNNLMEWIGAGFLATGAAATDDRVEEAALPFDRRRHGTILGMGACAMVVESEDAVRERGMRGIVEVLSSETRNSAFHGTRLDVAHISGVMDDLLTNAERRFGVSRHTIAPSLVFMSHETYTPARGGSASAEVVALRETFGQGAEEIVVANTKGFTGHPMGVGIEDVIAVKILEHGIVPPVPNYKVVDPDLGRLNLSRGGHYPVKFALHLAAGFGSQIAMTLTRRIEGALDRVDDDDRYQQWLDDVSGYDAARIEIVKRVLRIQADAAPGRAPAASTWRYGTGPTVRTDGTTPAYVPPPPASAPPPARPAPAAAPVEVIRVSTPPPASAPAPVEAEPIPTPDPVVSDPSSLEAEIIRIVANETGYPEDMLELDLDLEADLGIDTVKQAEIFSQVRTTFDIPRRDDLSLRDYPTLEHVVGFVRDMRPDMANAVPPQPAAPIAAPVVSDPSSLEAEIIRIVANETGYPEDMLELDLDLEADLGIDTVKQAEIFSQVRTTFDIPRRDDLSLRDYPTLEHVVGFVRDMRPDMAETASAPPVTDPVVSDPSSLEAEIIRIVANETGYPEDMLELDLDLEADLGIDTVKQAEIFSQVRTTFDIPRRDDLSLRDYPTLEHVIGFVRDMRPDMAEATSAPPVSAPIVSDPSSLEAEIIRIVASETGYPEDMLELDLDLEADLGIDTVKQAEIFSQVRTTFDIPRRDDLSLRDYPTLEHVIGFVRDMRPDMAETASAPPVSDPVVSDPSSLEAEIIRIVANETGYPEDMLELDLDLEADLGIDTVKQAEIFSQVRTTFDIPRRDDLSLRDYPTLEHVIGFVRDMRPDMADAATVASSPATTSDAAPTAPSGHELEATLEAADRIPRRVPLPVLRPGIDLCKPTGIMLNSDSRVVIMPDQGGVAKSLITRLEKLDVTCLVLDPATSAESLVGQLESWLADGPVQGVYWLPALDVEPEFTTLDADDWHALNTVRVKHLYQTMRTLYETIATADTFLISGTRLGGLHGYGADGATAPLGGSVTGFTKAYKRERPEVLVKAVDFAPSRKTADPADQLVAETSFDPGVVEVGYRDDGRYAISLLDQPVSLEPGDGMTLDQETVFLVTGAAGGITSAIVGDLARASGGTFYLTDLADPSDANLTYVQHLRADRDGLRRVLIDEARAAGESPKMVEIDRHIMSIERQEAALRAIDAVEAAGGTCIYTSANLLDADAMTAVVDQIRNEHGRIDVFVHAGGLEISRALPDKPVEQFDLVYDVKVNGFFNLMRAAGDMPVGAVVGFSSVAGRFGNSGQTDYSAANDLLCKTISSLRHTRPETRGIVIDWTAWGGIGMATRGSIPKIMEMAGIDMLPPESGIPTVRRELVASRFRGEIVVGDRLGILGDEWDATGGLDLEKAAPWLAGTEGVLAAGQVTGYRLYDGLTVQLTLDPNEQPFLYDHQMDGTPILPGVMGLDLFALLAQAILPDQHVVSVENVAYQNPFKFYRQEPQTLYLTAMPFAPQDGMTTVRCELWSVRELHQGLPPQEKLHFTAFVNMGNEAPPAQTSDFTLPSVDDLTIGQDKIYEVYFHGPAYQVLDRCDADTDYAIGLLAENLPDDTHPPGTPTLMLPRLIELCYQTAGMWEISTHKRMALPAGIRSVSVMNGADGEPKGRLFAVVSGNPDAGFDAKVLDEAGTVYVDLSGYRTVALPDPVEL